MPAVEHAQKYKRTFQIGRETDDKTSRPYFMEWVKELPAEIPQGAKYKTKKSATSGKVSYYRLWQGWSGHLVDIRRDVKNYGENPEDVLLVTLQDSEDEMQIELSFFNSYACDLMKRLLDARFDPSKNLVISPYAIDKLNGKGQNIGISAISGTDTYLAANKNAFGDKPAAPHLSEMPDLEKVSVKGRDTFDNTAQALWLWSQIESKVIPRLNKLGGAAVAPRTIPHPSERRAATADANFPTSDATSHQEDDLPF